ncbi:CBS domain-containing protein [Aestuariirhabdus sp. LZHN29]|uniref:CBS domain-containing protein n=1 Tax=Aestuariirhabdus sp. LZHN29 TaxID=3417462 RepID=UPI003CE93CDD
MNDKIVKLAPHYSGRRKGSVLDDRVAAEIMTTRVMTACAEWPLEQLAEFFKEHKISGAPVIDATGRLAGVVSLTDIVRQRMSDDFYRPEERLSPQGQRRDAGEKCVNQLQVADIMTPDVYDVTMNTPLHKVAAIMVKGNIHRVLVTHDKKVVGIISSLDMLRQEVS